MKPKKSKKQRTYVTLTFSLTPEGCRALSNALLFLLNLDEFSFEAAKISLDSADQAENKLFDNECTLTRGEVRATSTAIDVVLEHFPGHQKEFSYMDDEVDYLLNDLERDLPILVQLQPIFHTAVSDLKKMK